MIDQMKLEVVRYELQTINGEPKIVISQVKVTDENDRYVKFAKLEKVLPYLSRLPIRFKPKESDNQS